MKNVLILSCLWCLYFFVHSILASLTVKRWVAKQWPNLLLYYRFGFNFIATLLLIIPLVYLYSHESPSLWQWQGMFQWFANTLAVLAMALFVWSLRYYDMREFMGFKQATSSAVTVEDQESFKVSPLHRFVRHPWYSLGLVLVWTRDMDVLFLISAGWISLYFIFGSWLEEKKLVTYHGAAYKYYQRCVPALLPLPWRYLSKQKAIKLQQGDFTHCDS